MSLGLHLPLPKHKHRRKSLSDWPNNWILLRIMGLSTWVSCSNFHPSSQSRCRVERSRQTEGTSAEPTPQDLTSSCIGWRKTTAIIETNATVKSSKAGVTCRQAFFGPLYLYSNIATHGKKTDLQIDQFKFKPFREIVLFCFLQYLIAWSVITADFFLQKNSKYTTN